MVGLTLKVSPAVPVVLVERLLSQRYAVLKVHRPVDQAVITVMGPPKSGKTRLGEKLRIDLTQWGYDVIDYRDLNKSDQGPRLQLAIK